MNIWHLVSEYNLWRLMWFCCIKQSGQMVMTTLSWFSKAGTIIARVLPYPVPAQSEKSFPVQIVSVAWSCMFRGVCRPREARSSSKKASTTILYSDLVKLSRNFVGKAWSARQALSDIGLVNVNSGRDIGTILVAMYRVDRFWLGEVRCAETWSGCQQIYTK